MDNVGSILLVDDEETFRESTCRLLRRTGFDCESACNGRDAVQALQGRRFGVMVADICMPDNPDLQLVQAARERDSQMAVILVTGYPSVESAIRSIELSVVAYLTKPLDFDELLGHVKTAIERSRNRQVLSTVRERLQSCLAELEATQSRPIPRTAGNDELVSIGTIRTMAACLSDLLRLRVPSDMDSDCRNLCELLDCPQQPAHLQAIVETIDVLKKTKDTFRSKALAELRAKLEDLLTPRAGSCARP
jgi:DNA-binding response OmpR family regulator